MSAPMPATTAEAARPPYGWVAAGVRGDLLALLGYFVLALLATYPALLQFTSGVPGDLTADRDQNLWNLWWARQSLLDFTNPFHTDYLYFPYGADLYYHTLALPLGLIGLAPQFLFGLPAAYNTVLLVSFTLSGYGAFRLSRLVVGRGSWATFLAGVVFAFTPYTLDALKGQMEVLSVQWLPFFAEMWLRGARPAQGRPLLRRFAFFGAAGFFLALAAYTSLYYALYALIFALAHTLYMAWGAWRGRAAGRGWVGAARAAGDWAVVVGVAGLLSLPLLLGLARDRDNPRLAVGADASHRLAHSADLLSWFAPPHDHILSPAWADRPGVNEPPIHDYLGLGYAAFGLAVLGAVVGWRGGGAKFWAALGLAALVLAMGPELQVGRTRTGIPLPFALVQWLPGMDAIAKPERLVVLVRLCMAVLAALAGAWLAARFTLRRWGLAARRSALVGAGMLALLLAELPLHPRHMEEVAALPFYRPYEALTGLPAGGLMELPFATQQSETTGRRMLLQTVHGKPIMGGYLSRRYDSPIIDSCGPFWGFISPLDVPREDIASPLVVNRPLEVLNFYGIRYLSVYTTLGREGGEVDPSLLAHFEGLRRQVAMGPALIAQADISVVEVRREDLSAAAPSFHVGAGWHPLEEAEGRPFRWIPGGRAQLCVFAPREVRGNLRFEATSFYRERQLSLSVGSERVFEGSVPAGRFVPLETGVRVWRAGVTEVEITPSGEAISPHQVDSASSDSRILAAGVRAVTLEIEAAR